ncbi:hypothetical protein RUM43_002424 [Polyplax serrata]|uniref:Uncharacterized protein n=1 Tax=Polyplax serrata TaxID=468196 RepID=A0AAN8NYT3_POLSC
MQQQQQHQQQQKQSCAAGGDDGGGGRKGLGDQGRVQGCTRVQKEKTKAESVGNQLLCRKLVSKLESTRRLQKLVSCQPSVHSLPNPASSPPKIKAFDGRFHESGLTLLLTDIMKKKTKNPRDVVNKFCGCFEGGGS